MSAELFAVEPVGGLLYRVSLRSGSSIAMYIVEVTDSPIPGLSAPHSLWIRLADDAETTRLLTEAVLNLHKSGSSKLDKVSELLITNEEAILGYSWTRSARWNLSSEALHWSAKHLAFANSNTLFPKTFEHRAIENAVDEFSRELTTFNLCEHRLRDFRQLLVPKSANGHRPATQLDPLDAMLMTAALYEIGDRIERARLSSSEKIVHSFRFKPSKEGEIWDQGTNYATFQHRTEELAGASNTNYVVETDISAFYHRLSPSLVCAALERLGVPGKQSHAFNTILSSYSNEGLPVGPSISALLADAVLAPIDIQLVSLGARFVRFNDDYRFFCETELEAQRFLQTLAATLWSTARLTLQESKTRIVAASKYQALHGESGWLSDLHGKVAHVDYGQSHHLDAHGQKLVGSALSVLKKTLAEDHVAWSNLCRKALAALPQTERQAAAPLLLKHLGRIWALAPQLSRSFELTMSRSQESTDPLVALVVGELRRQSENLPDYAATWVLHAFERQPNGAAELAELDGYLGTNMTAARRELLVALGGVAEQIAYDSRNPWHVRARVFAMRTRRTQDIADANRHTSARERRWTQLLDEAITQGLGEGGRQRA